jgi:hypothetical protein
MKIDYLEGEMLDYWVAQAEQQERSSALQRPYTTSWADAGPIIEREQIDLVCDFGRWPAMHREQMGYGRPCMLPLVAAMRAYLAWKFGDEVPSSGE